MANQLPSSHEFLEQLRNIFPAISYRSLDEESVKSLSDGQKSIKMIMETYNCRIYICPYCDGEFLAAQLLIDHLQNHGCGHDTKNEVIINSIPIAETEPYTHSCQLEHRTNESDYFSLLEKFSNDERHWLPGQGNLSEKRSHTAKRHSECLLKPSREIAVGRQSQCSVGEACLQRSDGISDTIPGPSQPESQCHVFLANVPAAEMSLDVAQCLVKAPSCDIRKHHVCDFPGCSESFVDRTLLNDHGISHNNISGSDITCDKEFSGMPYTKHRIGNIHEIRKMYVRLSTSVIHSNRYKCAYARCRLSFKSKLLLKYHKISRHIRTVKMHEVNYPTDYTYKCDFCNATHQSTIILKYHRLFHLRHDKFRCRNSNRTFTESQMLKRHVVSKHAVHIDANASRPGGEVADCDKSSNCRTVAICGYNKYRYTCLCCGNYYRRKMSLRKHLVKEHSTLGSKLETCASCKKSFHSYLLCSRHVCEPETCNMSSESPQCGEDEMTIQNQQSQIADQSRRSCFQCEFCSYNTPEQILLNQHMSQHNNMSSCTSCGKSFESQTKLNIHMISFHSGDTMPFEGNREIDGSEDNDIRNPEEIKASIQTTNKHLCKFEGCNKVFHRPSGLSEHMKVHHDGEKYKCSICDKSYTRKRGLSSHMREEHGCEKHVKKCDFEHCVKCNKKFLRGWKFDCHVCDMNAEGKRYRCPQCGKDKLYLHNLLSHMKIHSHERPFKCEVCNYSAKTKRTLSDHMRTHSDAKPMLCMFCGSSFKLQVTLNQHIRCLHTGEKPLKCPYCDSAFSVSKLRAKHIAKVHAGKEHPMQLCSECGQSFNSAAMLKKHMRKHTGDYPHKCTYCSRGFHAFEKLMFHIRTHTGEKPEVCRYCGKGFAHPRNRASHERTHVGLKAQISSGSDLTTTQSQNIPEPYQAAVQFNPEMTIVNTGVWQLDLSAFYP